MSAITKLEAANDLLNSAPQSSHTDSMIQEYSRRSGLPSTSIYVQDDVYGWRPAELQAKEGIAEKINNPIMDYSTDYYDRVLAPIQNKKMVFQQKLHALGSPKPKESNNKSFKELPVQSSEEGANTEETQEASTISNSDKNLTYETSHQKDDNNNKNNDISPLIAKDHENGTNNEFLLQDINESGQTIIRSNLSDIPYLHEASILFNLAERHSKELPYTRAGNVLIAMNPQKWIHGLYSDEKRLMYANHLVWSPKRSALSSIDPHVYEISSIAYRGLVVEGQNQSIIMSGETGAGKTETVKILMCHLATFDHTREASLSKQEAKVNELELKQDQPDESIRTSRPQLYSYRPNLIFRLPLLNKLRKRFHHKKKKMKPALPSIDSEAETCDDLSIHPSTMSVGGATLSSEKSIDTEFFRHQPEIVANLNLIIQRVIDASTLLEAFGNAHTRRNENGSRFSKYTRLQFNIEFLGHATPSCTLAGSVSDTYLLEKSRITSKADGERSFHIFYQLLSASDVMKDDYWDGIVGMGPESFKYLGHTDVNMISGILDDQAWEETLGALEIFQIQGDDLRDLVRALCAVLQLGNLNFESDPDDSEKTVISNPEELCKCSDITGIDEGVLSSLFTTKIVQTPHERYTVPIKPGAAKDRCDSLAKELYARTFKWLVRTVNERTCAEKNFLGGMYKQSEFPVIGLLDIFGFEAFEKNQFEQMCINHANEKLQQKFIQDVFSSVQEEYKAEGIDLTLDDMKLNTGNNTDVLNMIEGRFGIIDILIEECFRPKGSDSGFVNKIYANASSNTSSDSNSKTSGESCSPLFKKNNFSCLEFGVKHFAADVRYDATNFLRKNMDDISPEVLACAVTSSNNLIAEEFERIEVKRASVKNDTVWKAFTIQLNGLMKEIKKTNSRYIRCIVPNKENLPNVTDLKYTLEQLRCSGVMSAVTVARAAFPNKMALDVVLDRFAVLFSPVMRQLKSKSGISSPYDDLDRALDVTLKSLESESGVKGYKCGKSKVYFRQGALEYLEEERLNMFEDKAIMIQSAFRCRVAKEEFEKRSLLRQKTERLNAPISRSDSFKKKKKKSQLRRIIKQRFLIPIRNLRKKRKSEKKAEF